MTKTKVSIERVDWAVSDSPHFALPSLFYSQVEQETEFEEINSC